MGELADEAGTLIIRALVPNLGKRSTDQQRAAMRVSLGAIALLVLVVAIQSKP